MRHNSPPILGLEGNLLKRFTKRQDAAGRTRYQELKQLARSQHRILAGTPGTLKQRSRGATTYWVREYIRVDGAKDDEHIGPVAGIPAARVAELRAEIDLARALAAGSSTLRVLGYQRVERKTAAVLSALFNRGLYSAGLTLVGSHAFGALLNELGLLAAAYRTQDIDVARAEPLAIAHPNAVTLPQVLSETGLRFVPVPGMPSHRPSASFKLPGAQTLAVDLLVPGKRAGDLIAVEELGAHAQTVPYLEFLLDRPLDAVVLSPNQVVPVKVPSPERFLLHKLFSSQRRTSDRDKARKDLEQAALLAAATEEETPGSILDAFRDLPRTAKPVVRRGVRAAANLLAGASAEAEAALRKIASG
jgi:hypothetical protein